MRSRKALADGVLLHGHEVVQQSRQDVEGDGPRLDPAGGAVAQGRARGQVQDPAGLERVVHHRRCGRRAADDARRGRQGLDDAGHPGRQPTAAHRHVDRGQVVDLVQQLERERALAADDGGIVVGRDEGGRALGRQRASLQLALDAVRAVDPDAATQPLDGREFTGVGVVGDDDERLCADDARGIRHGGAVIAGGGRDDASLQLARRERQHLVQRAPHLERAGVLQVLALEHHRGAELPGQADRRHRRRGQQLRPDALLGAADLGRDVDHRRSERTESPMRASPSSS